jgi:isopentenyl diphosphate isomerase/L-lactate dehydrogenase-like FMN-dependent dehydrogenase
MAERDLAALSSYQLIPRVLHDVHDVETSCRVLERSLHFPMIPLVENAGHKLETLSLLEAQHILDHDTLDASLAIPLLKTERMGDLMPKVRTLAARGVPALALDFTVLADTPPFGTNTWKPKTREDLAEIRAASGCPIWLYGICSPDDAELAMEAGLEAIVVHSGAGFYLDSPATIDVFPEVFDAVAGMMSVYVGGVVRSGIDVFRYLAVGAEAVIVDTDRSLANLQAELVYAMRLTGCETLADIDYDTIFAPLFKEQ